MDIAGMIAIVLTGTQFIKETLSKLHIVIGGIAAIVLSVLVSAAVVFYFNIGQPFSSKLIYDFIQVVVAANMGYKILAGKGKTG